MPPKKGDDAKRFENLYIPEPMSGCFLWLGTTTGPTREYGSFKVGSVLDGTRRTVLAHRYAWMLAHGPIPDDKHVCHKCDNPGCVNVQHLFLGTRQDNMDDMTRKGREARGEGHGWSKLTDDKVREIRKLEAAGIPRGEIAGRFGVTKSNIDYVVARKTWRHVA